MILFNPVKKSRGSAFGRYKFRISFDYAMIWAQKSRKPMTGSRLFKLYSNGYYFILSLMPCAISRWCFSVGTFPAAHAFTSASLASLAASSNSLMSSL